MRSARSAGSGGGSKPRRVNSNGLKYQVARAYVLSAHCIREAVHIQLCIFPDGGPAWKGPALESSRCGNAQPSRQSPSRRTDDEQISQTGRQTEKSVLMRTAVSALDLLGGRTRARTWDPLTKMLLKPQRIQRLL